MVGPNPDECRHAEDVLLSQTNPLNILRSYPSLFFNLFSKMVEKQILNGKTSYFIWFSQSEVVLLSHSENNGKFLKRKNGLQNV